jgi:hypothetical protein
MPGLPELAIECRPGRGNHAARAVRISLLPCTLDVAAPPSGIASTLQYGLIALRAWGILFSASSSSPLYTAVLSHSSLRVGLGARANPRLSDLTWRASPRILGRSGIPLSDVLGESNTRTRQCSPGEAIPKSRYREVRSAILMRCVSETGSLTTGACSPVIRDRA